jgi:hypothetical protein
VIGLAQEDIVEAFLWIVAAAFIIGGLITLLQGELTWAAVLIIVGLLIGPGGVSVFT